MKFATRSCRAKKRYRDHKEAVRVAQLCRADRKTPLRVYECAFCKGWHLTRLDAA